MASLAASKKNFKRMESRNKHSWWWDSHISPKNSKWLAENVEEMDQSVKRMLKLIEEEGDSFAKKAEIYYQKRPELITHVEEFYRMYRSLAERYDNVTGELRRNVPSDLRSQSSGVSDVGSEPPSRVPSPDRLGRRRSGTRPAGFDVFLKSGGSLELGAREGDETSTLDSESDSDDSSVNNYSSASTPGDYQGLRKRIAELESELRRVQMLQENLGGNVKVLVKNDSSDGLALSRIADYEEELQAAKEKVRVSEEEVRKLRIKLLKYESPEPQPANLSDGSHDDVKNDESPEPGHTIYAVEEQLHVTREKLFASEEEVKRLRRELESAQKDVSTWKSKLDREKREVSKLHDRISRYKTNLSERDQEIRALRETVSNANKSLAEENSQLQDQMTKLSKERAFLDDTIKEWDLRCQCLEEDLRRSETKKTENEAEIEQLKAEIKELDEEISRKDDRIDQMNQHLHQLHLEHMELVSGIEKSNKEIVELRGRSEELEREVERKRQVIKEGAEEKREAIRQLCFSLEHYRNAYQMLRRDLVGHNGDKDPVGTP